MGPHWSSGSATRAATMRLPATGNPVVSRSISNTGRRLRNKPCRRRVRCEPRDTASEAYRGCARPCEFDRHRASSGASRQNIPKLMFAHSTTSPVPIHDGSAALWHLAPVLEWLGMRVGYSVEPRLLEVAAAAMRFNVAKGAQMLQSFARKQSRKRALLARTGRRSATQRAGVVEAKKPATYSTPRAFQLTIRVVSNLRVRCRLHLRHFCDHGVRHILRHRLIVRELHGE